jgi:hypothetical protein
VSALRKGARIARCAGLILVVGSALIACRQTADANAAPFVVRASAGSQVLGDFNITRNPTLRGASAAFGDPDYCTLRSWFGIAIWRAAGFRLNITTLGGLASGETFCTDPGVRIDRAVVTGKRWHTRRGLFIGDSFAKFRQLYPQARRFYNGWGIVSVYQRCVIGVCVQRYEWVPRLTAVFRSGRVASFVFPVGAQGE